MLLLCQSPANARFSGRRGLPSNPPPPTLSASFLSFQHFFSSSSSGCRIRNRSLTLVSSAADDAGETSSSAAGGRPATSASPAPSTSFPGGGEIVSVGEEGVPLEGVIQFDRPSPASRLESWGYVKLVAFFFFFFSLWAIECYGFMEAQESFSASGRRCAVFARVLRHWKVQPRAPSF